MTQYVHIIQYSIITAVTTILILTLFGIRYRVWHPKIHNTNSTKFCSKTVSYRNYNTKDGFIRYYEDILSTRFSSYLQLIGKKKVESTSEPVVNLDMELDKYIGEILNKVLDEIISKYYSEVNANKTIHNKLTKDTRTVYFYDSTFQYPNEFCKKERDGIYIVLCLSGKEPKGKTYETTTKTFMIKEGRTCMQINMKRGSALIFPSSWTHSVVSLPQKQEHEYFVIAQCGLNTI